MCQETIVEHKGPGLMPLVGVTVCVLVWVILELLGLERGFHSLIHLDRRLEGLLGRLGGVVT